MAAPGPGRSQKIGMERTQLPRGRPTAGLRVTVGEDLPESTQDLGVDGWHACHGTGSTLVIWTHWPIDIERVCLLGDVAQGLPVDGPRLFGC